MIISNKSQQRELVPAGNYVARCYALVEIGQVNEIIQGKEKLLHKVRLSWEIPSEMRIFDEKKGPQPSAVHKDFTASLGEKANLRKMLDSWRGKAFTEDELTGFHLETVLGAPCMINIIHKQSQKSGKTYEEISAITPVPKGLPVPAAVNPVKHITYDNFDEAEFNLLPDFIKDKMKTSLEYRALYNQEPVNKDRAKMYNQPVLSSDLNMNEIDPASIISSDLPF